MAARRRWPRPVRGRKGERGRTRVPGSDRGRRRRNELKAHTVAATSDLWRDYRWRYFFITVSPGCLLFLSFLFFISLRVPSSSPSAIFSLLDWLAPEGLAARSSFGFFPTLPISPCAGNVHASRARRSARGGLYLNNIHELRYTRQIYYPGTRGFCEDPKPTPPRLPPFFSRAPFLMLPLCSASFVFLFFGITLRLLARAINPVCFYPPCGKCISTLTKF